MHYSQNKQPQEWVVLKNNLSTLTITDFILILLIIINGFKKRSTLMAIQTFYFSQFLQVKTQRLPFTYKYIYNRLICMRIIFPILVFQWLGWVKYNSNVFILIYVSHSLLCYVYVIFMLFVSVVVSQRQLGELQWRCSPSMR